MTRSRASTTTMGDNHHHLDVVGGTAQQEEEETAVMPGFRFHPTEEELIEFYLRRKVDGKRFNIDLIAFVDLYRYDPWDLPALASIGDKEWFFYVPRDRKYRNGDRPNRVTPSGYWKATGADRMVRVIGDNNRSIGLKKTLVFYVGKAPKGIRSSWIMNEYRLPHADADRYQQEISLCRVYKRPGIDDNFHLTGTTTRSSGPKASSTKHTAAAAHRTSAAAAPRLAVGADQPSSARNAYNAHARGTNAGTAMALSETAGVTGATAPPMFIRSTASAASLSSTTTTEEDGSSLYGHLKQGASSNRALQQHAALLRANSSAVAPTIPPIDELSRAIGSYSAHANPNQATPPLLPFPSLEKIWDWNPLLESPKVFK